MIKRDDVTQRIHSCPLRVVIVQGNCLERGKRKREREMDERRASRTVTVSSLTRHLPVSPCKEESLRLT